MPFRKNSKALLLAGFLLVTALCYCLKKGSDSVQVIEENGITVVNNPQTPLHPNVKLVYEEELSIGREEGDSNYVFFRPGGLAVDGEENIFLLDSGNHRVQCFDPEGHFKYSFGKKGQGPGEFLMPFRIVLWQDQTFYIPDIQNRTILCFKKSGEFLRSVNIKEGSPQYLYLDDQQNLLMGKLDRGQNPNDQLLRIDRYNSEGERINHIVTFKLSNFKFIRSGSSVTVIPLMFAPRGVWTANQNGQIFSGLGDAYEITVQNGDSALVKKIRREFKPVPVTDEDKAEVNEQFKNMPSNMIKSVDFCANKPAFSRFVIDDRNNLWVRLNAEFGVKKNRYDIFDPDGKFIYQVEISISPYLFKNGKIYTIEANEDGVSMVKRYRYHWEI